MIKRIDFIERLRLLIKRSQVGGVDWWIIILNCQSFLFSLFKPIIKWFAFIEFWTDNCCVIWCLFWVSVIIFHVFFFTSIFLFDKWNYDNFKFLLPFRITLDIDILIEGFLKSAFPALKFFLFHSFGLSIVKSLILDFSRESATSFEYN